MLPNERRNQPVHVAPLKVLDLNRTTSSVHDYALLLGNYLHKQGNSTTQVTHSSRLVTAHFVAVTVVAGFVGAAAEGADDGALAGRALGNGVVEGMALVAASQDGECHEFFDGRGTTKEGWRVANEFGEVGAIYVDEGKGDGSVAFLQWDGAVEPLGWIDKCESLACGVPSEFLYEGHRRGDVAFSVSFDGDTVDDDFGVTFLWDDVCPSAEGRCEDGPVPVYLVVRQLACEGQDEVMGEV